MLKLIDAKNGSLTCAYNNIWLHSRYNPQNEAEKYIESLNIESGITHFILIIPALGYIVTVLRNKFPKAIIISIQCDDFFVTNKNVIKSDFNLCLKTPEITGFLEKHIDEEAKIKIIEWRPSLLIYKEKYLSIMKTVSDFIKINGANKRTADFFRERWNKNCVKNAACIKQIITFEELKARFFYKNNEAKPVIITAAGPSLEKALPEIKRLKHQENAIVIAVSSALMVVCGAGIKPDIVAATDGGFWAALHLFEIKRFFEKKDYPVIAAPLNARIPSCAVSLTFFIYSDGSTNQNDILNKNRTAVFTLPERGTVSAAALDLAFALKHEKSRVYISGLDLSNNDIISHARPHSFEKRWRENESRFFPLYSFLYNRALQSEDAGTNKLYLSWFQNNISLYKGLLALGGINNKLNIKMES